MRIAEVVQHDPAWRHRYEEEAAVLRRLFGDQVISINHIGSTSVPGLPAKPIIDILLELRSFAQLDTLVPTMAAMGYEDLGDCGHPGRRFFPRGGDRRTHHLHIYEQGDPSIQEYLNFRDYLTARPDRAQAYGELKLDLAQQFAGDYDSYRKNKKPLVYALMAEAEAWARDQQALCG